jgi:hypothetical protein
MSQHCLSTRLNEPDLKLRASMNSPIALAGGEAKILEALAMAFPATAFRVREDAVGVFVLYAANAPGAPRKEEVRSLLNSTFATSLFKIPTLLARPEPTPQVQFRAE